MNIKQAGRYANYLNSLIYDVESLMNYSSNYLNKTETHLKNSVNPEVNDEVIKIENNRIFTGQIQDMYHLCYKLIDEKLQLSLAIDNAKRNLVIDWKENGVNLTLDTAYEYNKKLRELASNSMLRLVNLKDSSNKTTGKAYKFNVEGNQSYYVYDIEIDNKIDYDKSKIKDLYKKILDKTDKISILIEQAELEDSVHFNPSYDIRDSLDEIIVNYESSLKNNKILEE